MTTSVMNAPTTAATPSTGAPSSASILHSLVPELIALTLDAKQAHWNVVGPAFLPLHELTDVLAADLRVWTDRLAERCVALGESVDAGPATVAAAARRSFAAGWVQDRDVVVELASRIGVLTERMTASLDELERFDAVAHDAAIETLEGLEKHRWMLLAHIR